VVLVLFSKPLILLERHPAAPVTLLCARLYGRRAVEHRVKRALEALACEPVLTHRIELKPNKIQEALFRQWVRRRVLLRL